LIYYGISVRSSIERPLPNCMEQSLGLLENEIKKL